MFTELAICFHCLTFVVGQCNLEQSCNPRQKGVLNVHIVPHSHNDVGWIKTFDEYYKDVREILSSVVFALVKDPRRRFIQSIIDQHYLGLDFIRQTFGESARPSAAWQIDTFGHSIEEANILHELGFQSLFIGRVSENDISDRRLSKSMEFLQSGQFTDNHTSSKIFTHIFYMDYGFPETICFTEDCTNLYSKTIKGSMSDLRISIQAISEAYQTNHILIPAGGDFYFKIALSKYLYLDNIISSYNNLYNDTYMFYSTPACYARAVNSQGKTYSLKTDDFFPYNTNFNKFWVGFYTSRPTLKYLIRQADLLVHACKKFYSSSGLISTPLNQLVISAARKTAEMQHHDTITGTSPQSSIDNYVQRILEAMQSGEAVLNATLHHVLDNNYTGTDFVLCSLLNISYCRPSESMRLHEPLMLVVYNPVSVSSLTWIRIPVTVISTDVYHVLNDDLEEIISELVPIMEQIKSIPDRPASSANFELIFKVDVAGIGFSTFQIVCNSRVTVLAARRMHIDFSDFHKERVYIENSKLKLTLVDGYLSHVQCKSSGIGLDVRLNFGMYIEKSQIGPFSGAYIFSSPSGTPLTVLDNVNFSLVHGDLVTELHQTWYNDMLQLVTRLYHDSDELQLDWTVGSIPNYITDIVLQYQLVHPNGTAANTSFFTDANGRQLVHRPQMKNNYYSDIASSYFPVVSAALMLTQNLIVQAKFMACVLVKFIFKPTARRRLGSVPRQSRGGSMWRSGLMELMLHRHSRYDDGLGMDEPLDEKGADNMSLVVRGRHWLKFGSGRQLLDQWRYHTFLTPPVLVFANLKKLMLREKRFHPVAVHRLPPGLRVLSLEYHMDIQRQQAEVGGWPNYWLLRLENIRPSSTIGTFQRLHVDVARLLPFLHLSGLRYVTNANSEQKPVCDGVQLRWRQSGQSNLQPRDDDEEELLNYHSTVFVPNGRIRMWRVYGTYK